MAGLSGALPALRVSRAGEGISDQEDVLATLGADAPLRRKVTQVVRRGARGRRTKRLKRIFLMDVTKVLAYSA